MSGISVSVQVPARLPGQPRREPPPSGDTAILEVALWRASVRTSYKLCTAEPSDVRGLCFHIVQVLFLQAKKKSCFTFTFAELPFYIQIANLSRTICQSFEVFLDQTRQVTSQGYTLS